MYLPTPLQEAGRGLVSEAAIFSMRILIQEYLLLEFLKLVILSNNSYSDTGEESYRTYFCQVQ